MPNGRMIISSIRPYIILPSINHGTNQTLIHAHSTTLITSATILSDLFPFLTFFTLTSISTLDIQSICSSDLSFLTTSVLIRRLWVMVLLIKLIYITVIIIIILINRIISALVEIDF